VASNTWSTRSPRRLDRRRSDRGAARSHLLSHGSATPPTRPSGALSGDRMYPAPASAGAAVSRAWPPPTAWVDRRAWLPIRRHQNEAEPVLEALDHLVVPIDDESDQVRPHGHNPTEARNASTPGADNGSLKRTRSSGASTSSLRSVSEGRGRPRHVERHGVRVWMPSRARSTGPGSRASVMPRISSGPAVILSPSRAVTRRRSYLVPS
jgi:hypothetical protein